MNAIRIAVWFVIAALLWAAPAAADPGGHGNPHVPSIESISVVKVVDPFNADPFGRLYGTLDMMALVEVRGERIVVIAHEVFPASTPGQAGNLPGFPVNVPDAYDGVNRGLGLGAVTAWDLKTGRFSLLIPPKNTAAGEPYNETRHTSGTDGVKATPWETALIAEEWTQRVGSGLVAARGGHILEVDPLNPGVLSRVKAMGAFAHEGVAIQRVPGSVIIYQGDENRGGGTWASVPAVPSFACAGGAPRRGGAVYRFLPHQRPRAFGDLRANGGRLEAFDFHLRQWMAVPADIVAADNPDVIRCWADSTLSPVSLWERPEDFEYDHAGGNLYFAVTEKSCVVVGGRCRVDAGGNTVDAGGNAVSFDGVRNRAGHVVRLNPESGEWSVFVDADTVNAQFGIEAPLFGSPDNLGLDHEGRLLIAQDGGSPNDSLWIATPDKDADGVADHFQRFLSMAEANLGVPASCGEPTGFMFLGEKTLLFNFQGGPRTNDFGVVDGANAESVACAPGGVAVPLSRIMRIELGGSDD
jgi:hypothetical protein